MLIAILAFVAIFIVISTVGILLLNRERAAKKAAEAAAASTLPPEEKQTISNKIQLATVSLGVAVGSLEGIVPKSKEEVSAVQQRMIRAGLRNESVIRVFYGAKIVGIVTLVLVAWLSGIASFNYLLVFVLAIVAGYLGPDLWLSLRIKKRQKNIRLGLPDVLDLLIVCVEAGLSLDQATARSAEELAKSDSDVGDELGMVVLEQRAGCARSDAWRHFAERTDVPAVRNVVSMLVQAEQFGTSIAKTLRVHAETMRTKRIQDVEEAAAKTTIKILFPLVLFIFPTIFIVTVGPAFILMAENFSKMSH